MDLLCFQIRQHRNIVLIEDIYFEVLRCYPYPSLSELIEQSFSRYGGTKLSFNSVSLRTVSVPKDTFNIVQERIWSGTIPKVVLVGIVNAESYQGVQGKNPFDFKTYNLSRINVSTNENQAAFNAQEYDFENGKFLDGYLKLCEVINNKHENIINRTSFKNGKCLYGFELNPQLLDNSVTPSRSGNVKLDVTFAKQTPEAAVIILYGLFQSHLYIDKEREVAFET